MPMFKIWWPEMGQSQEDAKSVKGFDHESAARNWADWYDYDNDYSIVGGLAAEIFVMEEGESTPLRFTVFGEMTRSYRAREVGHVKA